MLGLATFSNIILKVDNGELFQLIRTGRDIRADMDIHVA
jgi:hypothetical protein